MSDTATISDTELGEKIKKFREVSRKGERWLINHMNPDGSIGPAEKDLFYYRAPWAFALTGHLATSSRNLDWIQKNMMTPEGAMEGVSPQGAFEKRYGSYPLACVLIGAALRQRFDILRVGLPHLETWQDPESGGFIDNRVDPHNTCEQELFPTAQGGMTYIMAGKLDLARMAGGWLKRLWEAQPDVEHNMYSVWTPEKGLAVDFPKDDEFLYLTHKDRPWQQHYNGGIAASFLAQLHMATGESEWLDLARKYQDFSMTTDECQFQSMQTCKSGWGSGLLYVITRQERYRDWTVRMGDWFADNQHEDGYWINTPALQPDPTLADRIHITIEFVMHVANIVTYLAVKP
jgi:hypothetical protein